MKRVFLETYGCQMNVADSETMAGVLERAGMTLTERPEDADAVLLNKPFTLAQLKSALLADEGLAEAA